MTTSPSAAQASFPSIITAQQSQTSAAALPPEGCQRGPPHHTRPRQASVSASPQTEKQALMHRVSAVMAGLMRRSCRLPGRAWALESRALAEH